MPVTPYFTEARFAVGPASRAFPQPRVTPYSIIDHPFRVLVLDSEFALLAVGTASIGGDGSPWRNARLFAEGWPHYVQAEILDRSSHKIVHLIAKPLEDWHAPSRA
jgi:hypothetical protein